MCDIREDDLGIDVASAESLITPRTKAIVPLHFSGVPCAIGDVLRARARHGLRVIEDACHAFGTTVGGAKDRQRRRRAVLQLRSRSRSSRRSTAAAS